MTVRSEILWAVRSLVSVRDDQTFSMAEVLDAMHRCGTHYADQSIRTHVGSVMCINAPSLHAVAYPDLERVERGRYRLVNQLPIDPTAPTTRSRVVGSTRTAARTSPDERDDDDSVHPLTRPIDPDQLRSVIAVLSNQPLTRRVAGVEAALEGLMLDGVRDVLAGGPLSAETAAAALAVRESLGRISDLIHAGVICATLPRILEGDERITVRPSLASGNDPTRHYDLETDRRIAEFKVAVWQTGSNVMRKRTVFADLVSLAMDPRPLRKQLFVMGDLPGRFLRGSRSRADMVLQRAHQNLRDSFAQTYGGTPVSVAEFTRGPASQVEIVNLHELLPDLQR